MSQEVGEKFPILTIPWQDRQDAVLAAIRINHSCRKQVGNTDSRWIPPGEQTSTCQTAHSVRWHNMEWQTYPHENPKGFRPRPSRTRDEGERKGYEVEVNGNQQPAASRLYLWTVCCLLLLPILSFPLGLPYPIAYHSSKLQPSPSSPPLQVTSTKPQSPHSLQVTLPPSLQLTSPYSLQINSLQIIFPYSLQVIFPYSPQVIFPYSLQITSSIPLLNTLVSSLSFSHHPLIMAPSSTANDGDYRSPILDRIHTTPTLDEWIRDTNNLMGVFGIFSIRKMPISEEEKDKLNKLQTKAVEKLPLLSLADAPRLIKLAHTAIQDIERMSDRWTNMNHEYIRWSLLIRKFCLATDGSLRSEFKSVARDIKAAALKDPTSVLLSEEEYVEFATAISSRYQPFFESKFLKEFTAQQKLLSSETMTEHFAKYPDSRSRSSNPPPPDSSTSFPPPPDPSTNSPPLPKFPLPPRNITEQDMTILSAIVAQAVAQTMQALTEKKDEKGTHKAEEPGLRTAFKPDEIGLFDPKLPEDNAAPGDVTLVGGQTYYRDVWMFTKQVRNIANTRGEEFIAKHLHLCLRGVALEWYSHLSNNDQRFYASDLDAFARRLTRSFRLSPQESQSRMSALRFTIDDVRARNPIRRYMTSCLRYGTYCNMAEYNCLLHAYNNIDPFLKRDIQPPTELTVDAAVDEYLERLEEKELVWQDIYTPRQRQPTQPAYQTPYSGRLRQSNPFTNNSGYVQPATPYQRAPQTSWQQSQSLPMRPRGLPNRNATPWRPGPGIGSVPGSGQPAGTQGGPQSSRIPYSQRTPNTAQQTRQGNGTGQGLRPYASNSNRQQSPAYGPPARTFHAEADNDNDENADTHPADDDMQLEHNGESYHIDNEQISPDVDEAYDEAEAYHLAESFQLGVMELRPPNSRKFQCNHCPETYTSRNKLFKHLFTEEVHAAETHTLHVGEDARTNSHPTTQKETLPRYAHEMQIARTPDAKGLGFKRWTYAKGKAALSWGGEVRTICIDSGSQITLIDRDWLHLHCRRFSEFPLPIRINGVGRTRAGTDSYCNIPVYFPGHKNIRNPTTNLVAKTFVEAHVVSNLAANLILGSDYLAGNRCIIDYKRRLLVIGDEGFSTQISIVQKGTAPEIRRTIRAKELTFIPPLSVKAVPISYKGTLPNRDFEITPHHRGVYTQLADCSTDHILVANYSCNEEIITESCDLGTLHDCEYEGGQRLGVEHLELSLEENEIEDYYGEDTDIECYSTSADHNNTVNTLPVSVNHVDTAHQRQISFGVTAYAEDSSEAIFQKLDDVIKEFPELWNEDRGLVNIPEEEWMEIPLVNDWNLSGSKLAHKVYPLGPEEQKLVDEKFDALHKQGRMEYVQGSTPFGSPVFVVWRTVNIKGFPERKGRIVVDIRGLNKISTTDAYPLPLQEDIIAAVAGSKYISTIDAAQFFFQWPVKRSDRHKFTVISHRGQEQYNVAPMGYKNSPPYVQRQMDKRLRPYRQFARCFIDDIVIFSKTLEEHIEHLRRIFKLLSDLNVTLDGRKAFLGYPSVKLLGQKVDGFGMATAEDKLKAIQNLAQPTTLKDLEVYLGLTGWMRQYVSKYAIIAEPLQSRKTEELRNAPKSGGARSQFVKTRFLEPNADEVDAYNQIQAAFAQPTILVHFDPARRLYMDIDTSKKGVGVMVYHVRGDPSETDEIHKGKVEPILFLSRLLSPAETRYWPTEMEMVGIVWAVRKSHRMIRSTAQPTIVFTDHSSTVAVVKQTNLVTTSTDKANMRLVRAAQYLSQFDLDVRWKPGRQHIVPDALSRLPTKQSPQETEDALADLDEGHVFHATIAEMSEDFRSAIKDGYKTDKHWAKVLVSLEQDTKEDDIAQYVLRGELIYLVDAFDRRLRLCIPKGLEKDLFELAHDQLAHAGFHRAYNRLRATYFIRKLSRHLKRYIQHCRICQTHQTKRHAAYGELKPIETPPQPFHTVTIDFVLGLPTFDEFDAALTVTDKFSKRVSIAPGKSTYTAAEWAGVLLNMLADWGIPVAIISDRDPKFCSDMWQSLFQRLGTKLLMTSAYHPQADGQSERTNQTVEIALRFFLANGGTDWPNFLPQLRSQLNNSVSSPTGLSPNQVIYGFRVREGLDLGQDTEPTSEFEKTRDVYRQEAADAIAWASEQMKARYDKGHLPLHLNPGDLVYMSLHKNRPAPKSKWQKLGAQRIGPFPVIEAVGQQAYRLELPPDYSRIHPVLSIEHLEPAPEGHDPYERPTPDHPGPVDNADDQYEVSRILRRRPVRRGRYGPRQVEYLVEWKGWEDSRPQWIHMDNISKEITDPYDATHPFVDPKEVPQRRSGRKQRSKPSA